MAPRTALWSCLLPSSHNSRKNVDCIAGHGPRKKDDGATCTPDVSSPNHPSPHTITQAKSHTAPETTLPPANAPTSCAEANPRAPENSEDPEVASTAQTSHLPPSLGQDASWDSLLLKAMPFSVAVISSDAKETLHSHIGSEPAAAQLLEQVLQLTLNSHLQHAAITTKEGPALSFLAALLGPGLEAAALKRAREAGYWKGSVSVKLAINGPLSDSTPYVSICPSPEVTHLLPPVPHSSTTGLAGKDAAASGKAGRPAEEGSPYAPEIDDAVAAAAAAELEGSKQVAGGTAKIRAGVAQGSACWKLPVLGGGLECDLAGTVNEPVRGMGGKGSKNTKNVRWSCSGADPWREQGPCGSARSPFGNFNESTASHGARGRVDDDDDGLSCDACPADTCRLLKSKSVNMDSVYKCSLYSIPSNQRSLDMDSTTRRRKNSLLTSERAVRQLESEIKGDDGSTRTRAFLRSLTQALKSGQVESSVSNSPSTKSYMQPSLVHSSLLLTTGSSILHDSSSATREFSLGALIQNTNHSEVSISTATDGPYLSQTYASQESYLSMVPEERRQTHKCLHHSEPTVFEADEGSDMQSSFGRAACKAVIEAALLPVQERSFDVVVTTLKPADGVRSPLLVIISDCTQHSRVRATLSALAESQLELLSSMMPQHAIQFLALQSTEAVPKHVGQLARAHKSITLMFMDICGFTAMCKNVQASEVMVFLNTLFSRFDQLTDVYGVHKVETAGDCYIVSGGIMSPAHGTDRFGLVVEENHDPRESAQRVMAFAKALLESSQQIRMPDTNQPVRVRVGIHTGDVVSGVIGCKLQKFSLFGDTMNTASRMESTGVPGRIHVSETTHELLLHEMWEPTGGVEVKGKGLMLTYLWVAQPTQPPNQPVRLSVPPGSAENLPSVLLKKTHELLAQLSVPIPVLLSAPQDPESHVLGAEGAAQEPFF